MDEHRLDGIIQLDVIDRTELIASIELKRQMDSAQRHNNDRNKTRAEETAIAG